MRMNKWHLFAFDGKVGLSPWKPFQLYTHLSKNVQTTNVSLTFYEFCTYTVYCKCFMSDILMDLTVFCAQYETFYTYTVTLCFVRLKFLNQIMNSRMSTSKKEVVNVLTPVGSDSSFSSKSCFLSRDRSSSFRVRCSWGGAAIATAKKQLMINMAFMVSQTVS